MTGGIRRVEQVMLAPSGSEGRSATEVAARPFRTQQRACRPIPLPTRSCRQAGVLASRGSSNDLCQCSTHELHPDSFDQAWLWQDIPEDACAVLLRKEVIQPHLPVRLPCYDLVPIASPTFDGSPPRVGPPASGVTDFRDLTGGVYKARERIHRSVADLRLLATPTSWGRVADPNPN